MKFSIEKVSDYKIWDSFVDSSPQGTIFSKTKYLQAVQANFELFFIFRGDDIRAGLSICLSKNNNKIVLDDLVIYNGLMFHYDPDQKEISAKLERFAITEFVIDNFVNKYSYLEISLSPEFEDLRPFQWHNYHSRKENERFNLNLRYTSYLDISEFKLGKKDSDMFLFKKLARIRKRRIKEGFSRSATLTQNGDIESFVLFYKSTMEKQGIAIKKEKLERISYLHNNLEKLNIGKNFFVKEKDGFISYVISICYDSRKCYALMASSNPASKLRYPGTFAYWNAAKNIAINNHLNILDLEGINSPERAWFKTGFGGNLNKYFEVKIGEL